MLKLREAEERQQSSYLVHVDSIHFFLLKLVILLDFCFLLDCLFLSHMRNQTHDLGLRFSPLMCALVTWAASFLRASWTTLCGCK